MKMSKYNTTLVDICMPNHWRILNSVITNSYSESFWKSFKKEIRFATFLSYIFFQIFLNILLKKVAISNVDSKLFFLYQLHIHKSWRGYHFIAVCKSICLSVNQWTVCFNFIKMEWVKTSLWHYLCFLKKIVHISNSMIPTNYV